MSCRIYDFLCFLSISAEFMPGQRRQGSSAHDESKAKTSTQTSGVLRDNTASHMNLRN